MLGSRNLTTLIILSYEIEDIIKIVKSLEDSGLSLKGFTETVQNEVKEQKGGFLSMLLGTLSPSLLGSFLTGKGIYRARKGKGINRAGEGILRVGYGNIFFFFINDCFKVFMPNFIIEVMLKKLVWLKKVKKTWVLMKLLSIMKLIMTVWNNKYI